MYTIPRGANVICNLRRFLLDPAIFEKPKKFSPERFLDADGSIVKYEQVSKGFQVLSNKRGGTLIDLR